jgi:hypothetical protein
MTAINLTSYDCAKKCQVYVGEFNGVTFLKRVKDCHYMIKEGGYGIQEDVIIQLEKLNCKEIIIKTKDDTLIYDFNLWLKKKAKNYGHGLQRFCSIKEGKKYEFYASGRLF